MEILRVLPPHENVVQLQLFSAEPIKGDEDGRLLTLFMDYLPITLQDLIQDHSTGVPLSLVQIYAGQLFSALAHLSSRNIVHRDLLPRNVLIDPIEQTLKLADFGCAKVITPDSTNHSRVGSWQYRAIELLFGATHYTTKAGAPKFVLNLMLRYMVRSCHYTGNGVWSVSFSGYNRGYDTRQDL